MSGLALEAGAAEGVLQASHPLHSTLPRCVLPACLPLPVTGGSKSRLLPQGLARRPAGLPTTALAPSLHGHTFVPEQIVTFKRGAQHRLSHTLRFLPSTQGKCKRTLSLMASWGKHQTNVSKVVSAVPLEFCPSAREEDHVEAEIPTLSPCQQPHLQSSE